MTWKATSLLGLMAVVLLGGHLLLEAMPGEEGPALWAARGCLGAALLVLLVTATWVVRPLLRQSRQAAADAASLAALRQKEAEQGQEAEELASRLARSEVVVRQQSSILHSVL